MTTMQLKSVAFTFDDGPVEPYTSRILEILSKHEARATFFIIGKNALRYPDTVLSILKEGHVIGNHTQRHNRWLAFSPAKLAADILLCQNTIRSITGLSPRFFRAPHGMAFGINKFLAEQGLTRVGWNRSSHDWRLHSSQDITNRVLRSAKPGAIVLFHDGFPPDKPRNIRATTHDLAKIVRALKEDDYQFVTAPEILGLPLSLSPARNNSLP